MKSIQSWLDEYGESHQNATNKTIHWICVPLIMLSIIGLLWAIPVPEAFERIGGPWLNFGTIFVAVAFLYYVVLSPALAAGMVLVVAVMLGVNFFIDQHIPINIWIVSLIIFAAAWVGQFYGHKVEGKKPSFLKDVQFLLIGPLWLLSFIYRSLGIRY